MTTVTEDFVAPGGATPAPIAATYLLVGEGGSYMAQAWDSDGKTIIGRHAVIVEDAHTEIDLTPNSDISPAGTRWRRDARWHDKPSVLYLDVPATGGPYPVEDIVSDPPGDIMDPDAESSIRDQLGDLLDIVLNGVIDGGDADDEFSLVVDGGDSAP